MNECISVIIPTFNRESFVGRAVESVMKQTWSNVEVIVVDDGSTDKTRETLEPFRVHSSFRYLYQDNKGRSVARNEGLRLSTGKWVMFLDSDDYLLPNALEKLHQLARQARRSSIVFANFLFVDKQQKCFDHEGSFSNTAIDQSLLLEVLNSKLWLTKTGTYLVKKELADEIGGFISGFEPSEDLDYSIKILMKTQASYTSDTVLYVERHGANTDELDMQQAIVRICRHYQAQKSEWRKILTKKEMAQATYFLRYRIANGSYEVNKHRDALLYYTKLIGTQPSLVFDRFIFKQFFASFIPPGFKKTIKKNGRQYR